jgi:hypothetical protein
MAPPSFGLGELVQEKRKIRAGVCGVLGGWGRWRGWEREGLVRGYLG